ncbi:hypothetical protein GCM10027589_24550 [Actinocorallia lasiicapitis]
MDELSAGPEPGDHRRLIVLSDADQINATLSTLTPRTCDFVVYEVADPAIALAPVRSLAPAQRLIAGAAAGRLLGSVIRAGGGYHPAEWSIIEYLRGGFPPPGAIPEVPADLIDAVFDIAQGSPGDPVAFGLFPSTLTKLARLALCRQGAYPAERVRRSAREAYGPDRHHTNRSYHAHDALAGALVHPGIDTLAFSEWFARQPPVHRGRRSRRKSSRILGWARAHGYLPIAVDCACGYERFASSATSPPETRLAEHWGAITDLMELLERDPRSQTSVYRCGVCGRRWVEECAESGHARLFYGRPLEK